MFYLRNGYDVRTFPQNGDFTGRKPCVKDLCNRLGQFVGKFFNYPRRNAVRPHNLVCFYMQKLFANHVGMYNRHFLSRMAAARRKEQGVVGLSTEKEEDKQCLQEYSEREDLINTVNEVKQRPTSYLF